LTLWPQKLKNPRNQNPPARQRDLDAAISSITKAYGDGSIMRLGDARAKVGIEFIPTGALAVDLALGVGGVPRGRVVEIFGPESSGKTTLMLHVIANAQKAGGLAAFIDAEHALDPAYAKKLGVNLDDLLVSQPDSGEEALSICETLARSNALDVIVVDSVAALVPKAELEGEMGMATMGMQARLMSQALRKLTAILAKSKTTCIFTNQLREKVGVMFGNPETTPGGKALKFYASIRIDIRRRDTSRTPPATPSATPSRSRLSKTKLRRPSPRPSSRSFTITASTRKAASLTSASPTGWWIKRGVAAIRGRVDRPGQGRGAPGAGGQARAGAKNRRRHHGQAQRRWCSAR
jgi:recombination protein RecA